MKWQEVAPGIFIFDDVLQDPRGFISDIESLVNIKFIQAWQPGVVIEQEKNVVIDKSYRNVFCIGLPKFDSYPDNEKIGSEYMVHQFLNDNLLPYFNQYCKLNEVGSFNTKDGWQLLKYGPEQFFDNHQDDNIKNPRTISMSYYPNDDYEGGEIEFVRFNIKIKPKANQAIFFPANYVYSHKVHAVHSGFRYAVVNWWDI